MYFSYFFKPLHDKNCSVLLKALKNKGVPAKDSGETGPTVIKAYCLDSMSKALCGSLNDW